MNKYFLSHIMHGLTHIIPLLIISGFMLVIRPIFPVNFQQDYLTPIIEFLWMILLPIFSAFVMFSISDRPGIVPGLVIGFFIYYLDLGYVTVILFSFMAAYMILGMKKIVSNMILSAKSIFSTIFIPVIVIGLTLLLIYLWHLLMTQYFMPLFNLNIPYGIVIALSVILASMMSYDFGGPVNKLAFLVGVISLRYNEPSILMAAVMAGGMIPPLGIALSKLITPKYFSQEEKKKAILNYLNGFFFMTEGVLPFVQDDLKNKRIICMIAGGLTGLTIALFKTKTIFPHGGIIIIPFMEQWIGFLIALFIGSIVLAISYSVLLLKESKNV
ncbi:MAG: fructose-specific PTS transporter subunit EIIC [Acholeplasmataceae bacterium]|nr:hypothetical protein [Acholeplasmataceae bacterium]